MIATYRIQHGFSLLEILVAFSILALSLGVLYQIFSQGSRSAILAEEYTRATIIAESRLASIGVLDHFRNNDDRGTEENKYHWSTSIQPYAETEPSRFTTGFHLYEVTTQVSWDSLGKQHVVELQTLKLLPDE